MSQQRSGFTTGTCAAAAAKAAARFLLEGIALREVEITLPGGDPVVMPLVYVRGDRGGAEAAIRKDAGGDPDITHGALVVVNLSPVPGGEILFAAGEGVGMVTKPGLSVAPGEPAINPVPRQMICSAIRDVTARGMLVTVSIPGGEEMAVKTFNPRLGIIGGLSVLGTTGIVRPFSISALRASLKCALDVAAACRIRMPVFVPGNIGRRAAEENFRLGEGQVIEAGNEWGFVLDRAAGLDFRAILVVGHPGKLAKLAAGDWDTHSSRSRSALPTVIRRAEEMFARSFPDQVTVEGLFHSLDPAETKTLGEGLAADVEKAVRERMGGCWPLAVVLIDMRGRMLGSSGDLSLWR